MSEYDLMKLFDRYDSEVGEGDFTPEELAALVAAQKGAEDAPPAFRPAAAKTVSAEERAKRAAQATAAWKEQYFAYYDDIKDKSLKRQDW